VRAQFIEPLSAHGERAVARGSTDAEAIAPPEATPDKP
jgi:hypothetical protein